VDVGVDVVDIVMCPPLKEASKDIALSYTIISPSIHF